MKKLCGLLLCAALTAAPTGEAAAQSVDELVAYHSLMTTPVGALPPILRGPMLDRIGPGMSVDGRYGYHNGTDQIHNFGLGLNFGTGPGSLGLTVGLSNCPDCADNDQIPLTGGTEWMFGAGWQQRFTTAESPLNIGADLQAGYVRPRGHDGEVNTFALGASIPVALGLGDGGMRFYPFVSPGFGWGRTSSFGEVESGTRFMLGGGLAIRGDVSPLALTLGFQNVFIDGGDVQFGAGLSWLPGR